MKATVKARPVYIKTELHGELKARAAKEGVSLEKFVTDILGNAIGESKAA